MERSTVLTGFDIDGDKASFSTTNDTIDSETITHLSLPVQSEVDLSTRLSTATKSLSSLPHSGHTFPAVSLPSSQLSLLVQSKVNFSTRLSTAAKPLSSLPHSGHTFPAVSLPSSQLSLLVQSEVNFSTRLSTAAKPLSSLPHSDHTSPAASLPSSPLSLLLQRKVDLSTRYLLPPSHCPPCHTRVALLLLSLFPRPSFLFQFSLKLIFLLVLSTAAKPLSSLPHLGCASPAACAALSALVSAFSSSSL
ncbi:hypothetical protein BU17DRAFT_99128 [Hysterangium stoloniferum]|nr:hypothetical protein BU17DRAFT_99128 [Hysterangium stoloniferum]